MQRNADGAQTLTIKPLVHYLLFLAIGFVLGFVYRDLHERHPAARMAAAPERSAPMVSRPAVSSGRAPATSAAPPPFLSLLHEQRYAEAVEQLLATAPIDGASAQNMRRQLLTALSTLAAAGEHSKLRELAYTWLASNANDVEVLGVLATSFIHTGEYHPAIETIHSIRLSDYDQPTASAYREGLRQLTDQAELQLGGAGDYESLLAVYQQLIDWGFDQPAYRYRLGELQLRLGDTLTGRSQLETLLDDPAWHAHARALLASLTRNEADYVSIDLEARAGQYLVDVDFSYHASARLLLDTGASISALGEPSFRALQQHVTFHPLGMQTLHTAGGQVVVPFYRLDQLALGDRVLQQVDFAILPDVLDGVDGVLGMNALSRMHFEIDQNASQLIIKGPRNAQ